MEKRDLVRKPLLRDLFVPPTLIRMMMISEECERRKKGKKEGKKEGRKTESREDRREKRQEKRRENE